MQIAIRNAAGGQSDTIEKNIAAGRTVLRVEGGERIEIVDPTTGRVPVDLRVRRGGKDGQDLIVESADETVEIQDFFEMSAEGEAAVALLLPGAESDEITPATPELAAGVAAELGGSALPVGDSADAWLAPMQAGSGARNGGGGSSGGASGGGAGAGASNVGWWVLGGIGAAAAVAAATDDDDDPAPAPAPEPTLVLSKGADEVNEGETVTFTITTTNVPAGTQYTYTISGVAAADVEGGSLTGTVTIGPDGKAVIPVTLVPDAVTEGDETLTVSVSGQSVSVTVKDTSQTVAPPQPKVLGLEVDGDRESVAEGQTVVFRLKTENVPEGTVYEYKISGVDAKDVEGGQLIGEATVNANGEAVIVVVLREDATTEGAETLTVEAAGKSASVTVADTSLTPTFQMSDGDDEIIGTAFADVIRGSGTSFTQGDYIDGGEPEGEETEADWDKLVLTLRGGAVAEGATVKNVEVVELRATDGGEDGDTVTLRMSDFDDSVQLIDISDATANVVVEDQQSIADVRIADTVKSVDLDYDSQVVNGESDALHVTIDEFGYEGEDAAGLTVDTGIEALTIDVQDGKDRESDVVLKAEGVESLTITGGREGQQASFELDDVNGERAEGATLDATGFAGDLEVTGIDGGREKFAYAVEFTAGLEPGEQATITINGKTFTVEHGADEADSLTADALAEAFEALIESSPLGAWGFVENGEEEGAFVLVLRGFDADLPIEAEVAGAAATVVPAEDYASQQHGELSKVLLGAGNDVVEISSGDVSYDEIYDLGDGDDRLKVADDVHGTVAFGAGNGSLEVGGDIRGTADVSFGAGENDVKVGGDIEGFAKLAFEGGDNTLEIGGDIQGYASVAFNGDGANRLEVEDIEGQAEVRFGGGDNVVEADDIRGEASVSFGDGDNVVEADDIEDDASVTFGGGDNDVAAGDVHDNATLVFGNGTNQLIVGSLGDDASVTFGEGSNTFEAVHSVSGNAALSFGGDADITVGEDIAGGTYDELDEGDFEPVTVSVAGNAVIDVEGGVRGADIAIGGAGQVDIGELVLLSNIAFGDADSSLSAGGEIAGSQITFGAGDDTLAATGGEDSLLYGRGEGERTVITMGEGDDAATLNGASGALERIVGSGAELHGGSGADTLTIEARGEVDVVARNEEQLVHVTFDGEYTVDDFVSITIGDDTFEYQVKASDVVQGDGTQTAANVANGLRAVIAAAADDEDDERDPALTATLLDAGSNTIVLTGEPGAADVAVTAEGATAAVQQFADARITGFETLNLTALNVGEDWPGEDAFEIAADFALIDDVEKVNLTSEVQLRPTVHNEGDNGEYTEYDQGNVVKFTLANLPASLTEAITVSGHEVTATGNRQVEHITIEEALGAHQVGDVITVTIGEEEYSLTVTAGHLSADTPEGDAANIAAALAQVIAEGQSGFEAHVDDSRITLIGSSDDPVFVGVEGERNGKFEDFGDKRVTAQAPSPADDGDADVIVHAWLAAEADGEDDTLALNIEGGEDFDVQIIGAGSPGFENLVLTVADDASHTFDLTDDIGGDGHPAFRRSVTLSGGAVGASLALKNVLAQTVDAADNEADLTIVFNGEADAGESYVAFDVATGSGNDVVDMRDVTLTGNASVALGEGTDRLVINNDRTAADAAIQDWPSLDEDRMFRGVTGVEELEVSLEGEDNELVFDDDAYAAGFEKLIVQDGSQLAFRLGNEFMGELDVEIGDNVVFDLEVLNDEAVEITAGESFETTFSIGANADASLTLKAGDGATVGGESFGNGALDIEAGENSMIHLDQHGDGSVAVAVDGESDVEISQHGAGEVAVSAGAQSSVYIEVGEDNDTDASISVVQTDSHENVITLRGVNAAQDVSVDITVFGAEKSTVIADPDNVGEDDYNTSLSVVNGAGEDDGGIDLLTVRSNQTWGASETVSVVVADSWAVNDGEDRYAGESDSEYGNADMTIDASGVVARPVVQTSTIDISSLLDGESFGEDDVITLTIGGVTVEVTGVGESADATDIGDALAAFLLQDEEASEYPGLSMEITAGDLQGLAAILGDAESNGEGELTLTGADYAGFDVGVGLNGEADESAVVTTVDEGGFVLINGALETEADLDIVGSATSVNYLLGGAGSDTLKGGARDDVLQGDNLARWVINFPDELLVGQGVEAGAIGDQYVTLHIGPYYIEVAARTAGLPDLPDGGLPAADLAAILAAVLRGDDPTGEAGEVNAQIKINLVENGEDPDEVDLLPPGGPWNAENAAALQAALGEFLVLENTVADGTSLYLEVKPGAPFPVSVDLATNDGSLGHWPIDETYGATVSPDFASDVLIGGEGNDTYVIAGSQFDSMDTIVGLNLGGLDKDPADTIALGAFIAAAGADASKVGDDGFADLGPLVGSLLNVEQVVYPYVSGDTARELSDVGSLEDAVNALFNFNDVFDDDNEQTSVNSAGLFSYKGETYLIAVGDNAEGFFGADDFIVKLVEVKGSLDVNDFLVLPV